MAIRGLPFLFDVYTGQDLLDNVLYAILKGVSVNDVQNAIARVPTASGSIFCRICVLPLTIFFGTVVLPTGLVVPQWISASFAAFETISLAHRLGSYIAIGVRVSADNITSHQPTLRPGSASVVATAQKHAVLQPLCRCIQSIFGKLHLSTLRGA
jgi:hypothetical protein